MTSPRVKPVELVARTLEPVAWGHLWAHSADEQQAARRRSISSAKVVLDAMRLHGLVNLNCIDLIHAEEDANGEPRTSIVPGRQG